jgi:hypothetical protein
MTSLAHFEKTAKAIETPQLAAIDGRIRPSIAGEGFVDDGYACDITMPFGDLERRDRALHTLYKCADLKSASITTR